MSFSQILDQGLRELVRDELRTIIREEVLPLLDELARRIEPPTLNADDLLTADEVARICSVERSTVWKWIRKDGLAWTPMSSGGREKRVRRSDLEFFLKNRAKPTAGPSIDDEVERVLSRHKQARR